MFELEGSTLDRNMLICNREIFAAQAIAGAAWLAVVCRNTMGAKLPFVYLLSALFLGDFALFIVAFILENWITFGVSQKGLSPDVLPKLDKTFYVFLFCGDILYFQAHWVFCWRYWKVANLLARVMRTKKHFSVGCVTLSNYIMAVLICVNYICALTNRLTVKSRSIIIVTEDAFPCAFIILDSLVLGLAVFRVREMLKDSPGVQLNEKYMTAHVAILLFLVVIQCTSLINRRSHDRPANILVSSVFAAGDCILDCIIAVIMWRVSGP